MAVGLVVAWILRGAPPGQAAAAEDDADAPRSGYRDRMIAAVVVGLLLISRGGYLALARGVLYSVPAFALGFGLVIFLIARNRRYRHCEPDPAADDRLFDGVLECVVTGRDPDRRQRDRVSLWRRAARHDPRGNVSRSRRMTKNQLETLDRPVTFTLLTGRTQASRPPA